MPTVVQDVSGDNALQAAIAALKAKIEAAEESGVIDQLVSDISTALAGKQNTLTFDNTPTASSTNPVTSGGVKTALDAKQDTLIFDNEPTAESTKPVTSGGVKEALDDMYSEISDRIAAAEEDIDIRGGAIYESASGSLVEITDGGDNLPMKSAVVNIEPIQDLHGYDSPWPAGGGKNLVDILDSTTEITAQKIITDVTLKAGTYILSADLKNTGEGTAGIRIGSRYSTSGATSSDGWKRVSTSPLVVEEEASFSIMVYGSVSGYAVSYRNIMIETGSEATSYAPYENICPISGRTGLNVVRCGKNLFPAINGAEYSGDLLSVACNNGEYTLTIGRYPLSVNTIFPAYAVDDLLADKKSIPAGTYTFSVAVSQWTAETELQASKLKLILTDNVTGSTVAIKNGQTETLTHDCTINSISCDRSYAMPASSVTKFTVQLEVGSTATEYEPYQADTYSVNWETEAGTVYGGTIDVVSGKLVVDRAKIVYNGSEPWEVYSSQNGFTKQIHLMATGTNLNGKANWLKTVTSATQFGVSFGGNNNTVYYYHITDNIPGVTNVNTWKAYLANNNLEICYPLATPIEIQLTPQEITTLLGENNIWSDGGDISVEYPADTKMYIDNKIAEAIAAAMA